MADEKSPKGLHFVGLGIRWPSTKRRAAKSAKRIADLVASLKQNR